MYYLGVLRSLDPNSREFDAKEQMEDPRAEIDRKIAQYSAFIKNKLHPELQHANDRVIETKVEVEDYEELYRQLVNERASSTTTTRVDLGHGKVLCKVTIDDPNTIFVNVGMGFHIELDTGQAINFVSKRIQFLRSNSLSRRTEKLQEVSRHLEEAELIISELSRELERLGGRHQ